MRSLSLNMVLTYITFILLNIMKLIKLFIRFLVQYSGLKIKLINHNNVPYIMFYIVSLFISTKTKLFSVIYYDTDLKLVGF